MKVLMFHGRAGGHNILPFLEYFNASTEHELTFIYANDRTYFPEQDNIEYHKFSFSPSKLAKLSKVIGAEYDLIWYHGGHSALILFIFSLLRNKNGCVTFALWKSPNRAESWTGCVSRLRRHRLVLLHSSEVWG